MQANDNDSELGEAWYPPSSDAEIKASTDKEVDVRCSVFCRPAF